MKTMLLVLLAAGSIVSAQGGKPASCTNVPVRFTITDYNPGLSSDGLDNGTYTNGNGVTAILNCNGESAELAGTRPTYLNLSFSQPLDGTGPNWPASAPISFFNIPFGKFFNTQPDPNEYTFATYLKVTMASSNPGFFYMENPGPTVALNPPSAGVNNSICNTTLVFVHHYPAGTYQTGAPETWVVYPDPNPQPPLCTGAINAYNVGTVEYSLPKNKTGTAQFSVPFKITIQRL
jgi:hypothetical protein